MPEGTQQQGAAVEDLKPGVAGVGHDQAVPNGQQAPRPGEPHPGDRGADLAAGVQTEHPVARGVRETD